MNNIVVFGASGGTGQQIVLQALALGKHVTAVVRSPERFKIRYDRLRVVTGDALIPGSFAAAMAGQDAVISALGVTGFRKSLWPMTFHVATARNITEEMARHGLRRFIGVTSVGVCHDPTAPLWYRGIVRPLLRHKYRDMARMEDLVRATELDWSLVRPGQLNDGRLTQCYRVGRDGTIDHVAAISRADVADLIVRKMTSGEFVHRAVAISYWKCWRTAEEPQQHSI